MYKMDRETVGNSLMIIGSFGVITGIIIAAYGIRQKLFNNNMTLFGYMRHLFGFGFGFN